MYMYWYKPTKVYWAAVRQKNTGVEIVFTSAPTTVTRRYLPWAITGIIASFSCLKENTKQ